MGKKITWRRIARWLTKRWNEAAGLGRFRALMRHLNGKSVAVVGNASSLLDTTQGPLIDSHDVVIRMNAGFPRKPEAQGKRFDVWCFAHMHGARQAPAGFTVPHAIWMTPMLRHKLDGSLKCCFYPIRHWRRLHALLGARPSMGAMVVELVSRAKPASVSIFGFDFKRTGSFYTNSRHIGPHDYGAEARYVLGMAGRPGWRFVATDPAVEPSTARAI